MEFIYHFGNCCQHIEWRCDPVNSRVNWIANLVSLSTLRCICYTIVCNVKHECDDTMTDYAVRYLFH